VEEYDPNASSSHRRSVPSVGDATNPPHRSTPKKGETELKLVIVPQTAIDVFTMRHSMSAVVV
jgi:hypothetical protein